MITAKHLITGYDVLPDGRLKPSAALKYMQDAATLDASMLGADYATMRGDNMIFVISKAKVVYKRVPGLHEELEIRTWNGSIQGVSFVRDFMMYVGGEEVARATTRWVLVSDTERKILRPDALKNSVLTNTEEQIGIEPERRIKFAENEISGVTEYRTTLTDMDTNCHVNNSRYADYLVDYCNIDLLHKEIIGFEIHFVSELKYGAAVKFVSAIEGDRVCVFGVKEDGRQAFASYLMLGDK